MTEPNDPASAPLVPAAMLHALTVAHAEIDRLRSLTRFQDGVIRSGDTACLTQAEREAVEAAVRLLPDGPYTDYDGTVVPDRRATLRGLLERLGGGR